MSNYPPLCVTNRILQPLFTAVVLQHVSSSIQLQLSLVDSDALELDLTPPVRRIGTGMQQLYVQQIRVTTLGKLFTLMLCASVTKDQLRVQRSVTSMGELYLLLPTQPTLFYLDG